jgi:flavodoxin
MNIGIILHSQTGNTYSVGQKIEEKLKADGHSVKLIRIRTKDAADKNEKDIRLDCMPEVKDYDALVFGGWIQAFNLYPGVSMYLNQLPSLSDKKVTCFLTQHFRYKWMGGMIGLSKMKKILTSKGAIVLTAEIINWSEENKRVKQIADLVEKISRQYI